MTSDRLLVFSLIGACEAAAVRTDLAAPSRVEVPVAPIAPAHRAICYVSGTPSPAVDRASSEAS